MVIVALLCGIGVYFDLIYLALLPLLLMAAYLCYNKPFQYVLIICFCVPLSIFINDVGGGLGLSLPTEPMVWLIFLLFVFQLLTRNVFTWDLLKQPLVLAILINLFWMFLSMLNSSMPFVSFKYFMARTWFVVVFFFFLVFAFKDVSMMRRFLTYMLLGTFIVVAITLFKHSREGFSRGWGYSIMQPFFEDHTIYSAYIAFFVPVSLMFALRGNWFKFNAWYRLFFALVFIVLIIGVVFSFTRASWISLIVALGFYGLIKLKVRFQHLLLVIGLVAVVAIVKQDQILYALESNKQGSADDLESHAQSVSNITTDPSNLERLNRWQCAVLMFKSKPVFGFGPGTYTFQYAPFQRPESLTLISTNSGDLGNTHNEYLNALSEMGLIGGLSWLAVFLMSIYTGMNVIYDEQQAAWKKSLATATVLGLITYYVHAFLNNFSDFDKIAVPLWGFMAVLTALKYYVKKASN